MRVPTALRGPGFAGRRVGELVTILDLHATLLDAAGLDVPEDVEGQSVMPLLRGEADDWPEDVFFQVSESEVGRGLRTRRWKYGVTAGGADPWNDPHAPSYVESYLYDLKHDPYELFNLAGHVSHAGVSAALGERLLKRMEAVGEPPATITPAEPVARYGQLQVEPIELGSR